MPRDLLPGRGKIPVVWLEGKPVLQAVVWIWFSGSRFAALIQVPSFRASKVPVFETSITVPVKGRGRGK